MRNILIHEYDDVDFHIVWQTVKRELPQLVSKVDSIADQPWGSFDGLGQ